MRFTVGDFVKIPLKEKFQNPLFKSCAFFERSIASTCPPLNSHPIPLPNPRTGTREGPLSGRSVKILGFAIDASAGICTPEDQNYPPPS